MQRLSPRQESIFNRVVDTHIETGVPVGSKSITALYHEMYRGSYSPATVRQEMGAMEQLGYLTHPHTSAGRVPTDKGYRYYIDHSMCEEKVSRTSIRETEAETENLKNHLDLLGERICSNLSKISEEVGVFAIPVHEAGRKALRLKVYIQGSSRFLEKPEFKNLEKIREIFKTLENKEELAEYLQQVTAPETNISVSIGEENSRVAFRECSIISKRVDLSRSESGMLAIIGLRRMRYSRVIPLVEQMGSLVKRILNQRDSGACYE